MMYIYKHKLYLFKQPDLSLGDKMQIILKRVAALLSGTQTFCVEKRQRYQ